MPSLQEISAELYSKKPTKPLYHYTSLKGMMGIASSGELWASEIRCVNDASELGHFGGLLNAILSDHIEMRDPGVEIALQFQRWLKDRFNDGPLLFVGSLTENGNLLSQWRGYCPPGQGVSLGFEPHSLNTFVAENQFRVGQCIYDRAEQKKLAGRVIRAVVREAEAAGPDSEFVRHPSQSFEGTFFKLEENLLRIAALVKHTAFQEEVEWRIVSTSHSNYVASPIRYREGTSMLIPYIGVPIPIKGAGGSLHSAYVGPTPTPNLSIRSVSRFLSKTIGKVGQVAYCQIPYRKM